MEVVVRRAGALAVERAYNVRLPRPTAAEQQDRSARKDVFTNGSR